MEFNRTTRKLRAISMVSLIDIIFTVILFFIVAGHMEKFSIIPVALPVADSGQKLEEGPIVVLLGKLGEVIINDEYYTGEQVGRELKRQFSVNPERIITIKADAAMDANKLVEFFELIRAAGGKNLSLMTQEGQVLVK
jgi:biopolymer transport protein ExbD